VDKRKTGQLSQNRCENKIHRTLATFLYTPILNISIQLLSDRMEFTNGPDVLKPWLMGSNSIVARSLHTQH
jgi:hypothetical protein